MPESSAINEALRRLDAAMQTLESAVEAQQEKIHDAAGLEDELHRLGLDRSQLAQSLDTSETRSAELEDANREVSRRLVTAMESIRHVLAAHGG